MLYREIIAVCSQIHAKHINTLCGQNVESLNVIEQSVPKRRHIKFRRQGITKKKECNSQYCAVTINTP